jgi:hypothetical protein
MSTGGLRSRWTLPDVTTPRGGGIEFWDIIRSVRVSDRERLLAACGDLLATPQVLLCQVLHDCFVSRDTSLHTSIAILQRTCKKY